MTPAGLHVDRRRLAADLAADHRRFEAWLADPVAALASWDLVEQRIEEHVMLEEAVILPDLAREVPARATEMRRGHAAIRSAVARVRVAVRGGGDGAAAIRALAETMQRWVRREEDTLDAWSQFRVVQ